MRGVSLFIWRKDMGIFKKTTVCVLSTIAALSFGIFPSGVNAIFGTPDEAWKKLDYISKKMMAITSADYDANKLWNESKEYANELFASILLTKSNDKLKNGLMKIASMFLHNFLIHSCLSFEEKYICKNDILEIKEKMKKLEGFERVYNEYINTEGKYLIPSVEMRTGQKITPEMYAL